jgi:hypothetical protein
VPVKKHDRIKRLILRARRYTLIGSQVGRNDSTSAAPSVAGWRQSPAPLQNRRYRSVQAT